MHKKISIIAASIALMGALSACGRPATPPPTVASERYTAYGHYYTEGTLITNDGNAWDYHTDAISDQTPVDAMPVWAGFDDNGTPADITDDIVLGLVYDRETAIYDALETALEDEFAIERDGNNIRIKGGVN